MAEPLGRREFLVAAALLSGSALDESVANAQVSGASALDSTSEPSVSELKRLLDGGALSAVTLAER